MVRDNLWLFGCLGSEPRLAVAYWRNAKFVRRLGEAAVPGGGESRPCPVFASYTLAFALQLRNNHGKTSEYPKGDRLIGVDHWWNTTEGRREGVGP